MRAWNDERVELLTKYAGEDLSAGDIADRLGVTRNVVCGKAHRLGLTLRGVPGPKGSPRPWRRKSNNPFGAKPSPRQKRAPGETPAHATPQGLDHSAFEEMFGGELVALLDLKPKSCRWPIGDPRDADFGFCGRDKVHGQSYCPQHCRIAFHPIQARRKEAA